LVTSLLFRGRDTEGNFIEAQVIKLSEGAITVHYKVSAEFACSQAGLALCSVALSALLPRVALLAAARVAWSLPV
jgi:hypothetical protein